MNYQILIVFRTLIVFKKESSHHFIDVYKLKFLTNFVVNMTSFLEGVPNYVSNLLFVTLPKNDIGIDIKICQELHVIKIFKMVRGFFLERSRSSNMM